MNFCMYLIIVFTLLLLTSSEVRGSCKHWRVGKYMYCDQKLGVQAAQQVCKGFNATLATIQTFEDQETVENEMGFELACQAHGGGSPDLAYIGLNDVDVDKTWRWPDGRILNGYTQWHKDKNPCQHQPNGNTTCKGNTVIDQDYVAIQRCHGKNYGNWFDVTGTKPLRFVCELLDPSLKSKYEFGTKQPDKKQKSDDAVSTLDKSLSQQGTSASTDDVEETIIAGSKQAEEIMTQKNSTSTKMATTATSDSHVNQGSSNENKNALESKQTGKTLKPKALSKSKFSNTELKQDTESEASANQAGSPTKSITDSMAHATSSEKTELSLTTEAFDNSDDSSSERTETSKLQNKASGTQTIDSTTGFENQDLNDGGSISDNGETETDNMKDQLRCLMFALKPETLGLSRFTRMCSEFSSVFRFLDPNPIIAFENNIAYSAANLMLQSDNNRSVRASVPGIDLTITPMRERNSRLSKNINVQLDGNNDCEYCDAVMLQPVGVLSSGKRAVLVSAVLKEYLLYDSGVYDEKQLKTSDVHYKTSEFIQKSTSILSVSLFVHDDVTGHVEKVSIPANMNVNIRNDDSEVIVQEEGRIVTGASRKCVYFDADTELWSSYGCKTFEDDPDHISCQCNHTTSFAVMVSLSSFEIPYWEKILLLFTEILGVVFLCLTLCLLIWMRRTLKKDRVFTQINLTLSLILMHVFMLIGEYSTTVDGLCVTMTFFAHFFMISSSLWMLNEGMVLYKKTCGSALNFTFEKLKRWLLVIGWGVPAVYVIICLAIGLGVNVYMDISAGYKTTLERRGDAELEDIRKYDRCWLGSETKMILAGLIPLALSLIATSYFLIRVSRVIWFMNVQAEQMRPSDTEKRTPIKATFRAVALLLPVLGIPWLLAFMVNIQGAEIAFVAIHGIANGLQGVFIFMIYIVANGEVRVVAKRRMTRSRLTTSSGFSFSGNSSVISIKRLTRGTKKSKKSVSTVSASTNHSSSL